MTTGPDTGLSQAMGRAPRVPAPFAFLWAAQFLSQFGDSIFQIAFVWLILDLTGSKAATGVAATISYLPALLFGVVAGLLVDRWNRRLVMAGADLGRALLLALAGVSALAWNSDPAPAHRARVRHGNLSRALQPRARFDPPRDRAGGGPHQGECVGPILAAGRLSLRAARGRSAHSAGRGPAQPFRRP